MSARLAFDSLCLRDSRLFGWGWLLDPRVAAARIEIVALCPDGGRRVLRCHLGGSREDVAEAFPAVAHARNAGFLVYGRVPADLHECEVSLVATFSDGSEQTFPLPGFPRPYLTQGAMGQLQSRWRLASKLMAQGHWRQIFQRGLAALSRRLSRLHVRLRNALQRDSDDAPILIIDHDMGGGANHFRDEMVARLRASGHRVLLFVPHLATLTYTLVEPKSDGELHRSFDALASGLAALPPCHEIIVNSLVSFDDPGLVLDWLLGRPAETRLTFYLHDYHPACPVWTLVDERGGYCGVPGLERCRQCLMVNEASFLSLMPSLDIAQWRGRWERFLVRADRVFGFSRASVEVLRKAFPAIPEGRVTVAPHDTSYIRPEAVAFDRDLPLTIGVVGHINAYKGADIVAEMARIIERESLPARIVVIGSIDNVPPSDALRETGPYRGEDLPEILRRERVGVCLLPSVWHETFSYVTAEIMAYGMPLAVFDLGAPAERVRAYARGRIIPEVSARAALDALFELRHALIAGEAGNPITQIDPQ